MVTRVYGYFIIYFLFEKRHILNKCECSCQAVLVFIFFLEIQIKNKEIKLKSKIEKTLHVCNDKKSRMI